MSTENHLTISSITSKIQYPTKFKSHYIKRR